MRAMVLCLLLCTAGVAWGGECPGAKCPKRPELPAASQLADLVEEAVNQAIPPEGLKSRPGRVVIRIPWRVAVCHRGLLPWRTRCETLSGVLILEPQVELHRAPPPK